MSTKIKIKVQLMAIILSVGRMSVTIHKVVVDNIIIIIIERVLQVPKETQETKRHKMRNNEKRTNEKTAQTLCAELTAAISLNYF